MKIICTDNKNYENDLIIGKIYNAIYVSKYNFYMIKDEANWQNTFDKKLFKTLSEYRIEKINKLLDL
jgi:hypothetical protein